MKENQNIEWKKSWRDEYIKWICGFANAAGVPAPEINYAFAGLMITFQARTGETGKISPETRAKTRAKTREKILKLILEDTSISIEEMSNRIGITQKGIEWQIMRLKKDGILERIGPARGGYWKVIEKKL